MKDVYQYLLCQMVTNTDPKYKTPKNISSPCANIYIFWGFIKFVYCNIFYYKLNIYNIILILIAISCDNNRISECNEIENSMIFIDLNKLLKKIQNSMQKFTKSTKESYNENCIFFLSLFPFFLSISKRVINAHYRSNSLYSVR